MNVIVDLILKNNNLKKLLYYTVPDCLEKPRLTEDQSLELFGKNIKIIPKLTIDHSVLNYVMISFDSFVTNQSNPQFRNNTVEFDIICHYDQWMLRDYSLRPFRIAAEIDSMIAEKTLTNMGTINFMGGTQMILSDEFAGFCLMYHVIHGGEDKVGMPNPNDEESFINNFNEIFNRGSETRVNIGDSNSRA